MDINYMTKGYDNGWTPELLDKFLKMKIALYLRVIEENPRFKENCTFLGFIGMSGEEYWEWVTEDKIHARISRSWPMPSYDWENGL